MTGVQTCALPIWTEVVPATQDVLDANGAVVTTGVPEHQIIHPAIPAVTVDHPAEYTIEVTDITSQVEQEKINAEALAYLASTDWMIVRAMENADKPVSEEIKLLRQQARDRIVK